MNDIPFRSKGLGTERVCQIDHVEKNKEKRGGR